MPELSADVVTVSHKHYDHNNVKAVKGNPRIIQQPGKYKVDDATIEGVSTFHDGAQGRKQGKNTVFVYSVEGMRICHLGDLGHLLTEEQLEKLDKIDVLLIPVGGKFTIDARLARQVVEQVNPSLVIPMHFKTPVLSFPRHLKAVPLVVLDRVDKFVKEMGGAEQKESSTLEVNAEDLPKKRRLVVLAYN